VAAYDLFITHAWRYHDDWKRMVDLLNTQGVRSWRNFSLPWYDPALDPRSEKGGKILRWNLETQIIPAHAVLLLSSVFQTASSRKWLDYEIEMALKHGKPIIAVPPWGDARVPDAAAHIANVEVGWDAPEVFAAVRRSMEQPLVDRESRR